MKAAFRFQYGGPDSISIREVDKRTPAGNELFVKVLAATVNRTDCAILTGKPFVLRFFTGLFKPTSHVPGTDFAGQIEAVGKNVSDFRVGDRVWGFNDQGLATHAQYVTLSDKEAVVKIPENVDYEQAVASAESA